MVLGARVSVLRLPWIAPFCWSSTWTVARPAMCVLTALGHPWNPWKLVSDEVWACLNMGILPVIWDMKKKWRK
jgi:hypothetical protein